MKSHVEFRSASFPADESEHRDINSGRYGRRLAETCSDACRSMASPRAPSHHTIGDGPRPSSGPISGSAAATTRSTPDGFLCFVELSRRYVRGWVVKKIDVSAEHTHVVEALDRVLSSHPAIRQVRWWTEKDFA